MDPGFFSRCRHGLGSDDARPRSPSIHDRPRKLGVDLDLRPAPELALARRPTGIPALVFPVFPDDAADIGATSRSMSAVERVGSERTIRKTSSQASQNRLLKECRSKAGKAPIERTISRRPKRLRNSVGIARRKWLAPPRCRRCLPYPMPCLGPGSRVQAATGLDQRNGPALTDGGSQRVPAGKIR